MSNILQEYQKRCDIKKVKKVTIPENYYPCPFEKYISFCFGGETPSCSYRYFEEVIGLIAPQLHENGIGIIQIPYENSYTVPGIGFPHTTDYYQLAYILRRSLVFVSGDCYLLHLAKDKKVPTVGVFSPSTPQSQNLTDIVCIESDRNGWKATFDPLERSIDNIKPEIIANAILKLLNLKPVNTVTNYIGPLFNSKTFHIVPDFVPKINPKDKTFIRLDLLSNLEIAEQILQTKESNIIIDEIIDLNFILNNIQKIKQIAIKIDDIDINENIEWFKNLKKITKNVILASDLEEINDKKLVLLENEINFQLKTTFFNKPFDGKKENVYFKTNKIFLSRGKAYLSEWHYRNKKIEEFNSGKAPSHELFWKSYQDFLIYEYGDSKKNNKDKEGDGRSSPK